MHRAVFVRPRHRLGPGGVCGEDQHRAGSERLRCPAALHLHHLHRLPGPGVHVVFQLDGDDLPRQDKEQNLRALPGEPQPAGGVRRLDDGEGQQHLHRAEGRGAQRRRQVHLPRQEPQGEECAAQRHHHPHRGPQDGGDGQHPDAHHRGRRGGGLRPPHPLHARQEGHPLHHQEGAGWEEGVPGQLLGQRQHGERPGGLQGGTKSPPEGMKQRTEPPAPSRAGSRAGAGGEKPLPFVSFPNCRRSRHVSVTHVPATCTASGTRLRRGRGHPADGDGVGMGQPPALPCPVPRKVGLGAWGARGGCCVGRAPLGAGQGVAGGPGVPGGRGCDEMGVSYLGLMLSFVWVDLGAG